MGDVVESVICRTVGCTSIFSHRFMWPAGVCRRFVFWRHGEPLAKWRALRDENEVKL